MKKLYINGKRIKNLRAWCKKNNLSVNTFNSAIFRERERAKKENRIVNPKMVKGFYVVFC